MPDNLILKNHPVKPGWFSYAYARLGTQKKGTHLSICPFFEAIRQFH